jgi:UPF0716 protein FxsA
MLRYIAALLLIPFLDAVVLVTLVTSGTLSGLQAIALVVLTALVGMLLVRAEGRRTLKKIQSRLAAGEPPTNELLDGGLLIAAGAFLLTPGVVTDAVGIVLTVPVTRIPLRMAVKKYVVVPKLDSKVDGFASGRVWTYGFPDPDEFQGERAGFQRESGGFREESGGVQEESGGVQGGGRVGDAGSQGGDGAGRGSRSGASDPIDLDEDAFEVDVEDVDDDHRDDDT